MSQVKAVLCNKCIKFNQFIMLQMCIMKKTLCNKCKV